MTHVASSTPPVTPDYGRPPPRRSRVGRTLAWGFGAVVAIGFLGSILLPNMCKSRETANRAKCASNLHQIGLAILLYQADNNQAYPPTLGVLPTQEQIGAEVFVCPSGPEEKSSADTPASIMADIDAGPAKHHCSYLYFGRGLTPRTVTDTTVITCDLPSEHDGDGVNVLYGDGHAEWETPGSAVRFLPPGVIPDEPRWRRAAEAAGAATRSAAR